MRLTNKLKKKTEKRFVLILLKKNHDDEITDVRNDFGVSTISLIT